MSGVLLYDALNESYKPAKEASLEKYGYHLDPELSNVEEKVFYNPTKSDLLITYRGSQNILNDWLDTNVNLLKGKFQDSDRYKRSKEVYEKAKHKYNKDRVKLVGHSLGGGLASSIGSDKDTIISYNKAPSNYGSNKKHEKAYRTSGDLVSLLSKFGKNTINLSNNNKNILKSHALENLKNQNIFI